LATAKSPVLASAPPQATQFYIERYKNHLADIKPSTIRYVGLANSHIDHIGNVAMFSGATILMQRAEWDFAEGRRFEGMLDEARLRTDRPVMKIEGDYDGFGEVSGRLGDVFKASQRSTPWSDAQGANR
jgi:glyoxylase-like metal-dependent hydrolase (beta-lactamase superfamily II)